MITEESIRGQDERLANMQFAVDLSPESTVHVAQPIYTYKVLLTQRSSRIKVEIDSPAARSATYSRWRYSITIQTEQINLDEFMICGDVLRES